MFFVAALCVFCYCGATVKLGKRTFFGHVQAIWAAEETQDMVDGVKEKSAPAMDKLQRGIEAGAAEMGKDDN